MVNFVDMLSTNDDDEVSDLQEFGKVPHPANEAASVEVIESEVVQVETPCQDGAKEVGASAKQGVVEVEAADGESRIAKPHITPSCAVSALGEHTPLSIVRQTEPLPSTKSAFGKFIVDAGLVRHDADDTFVGNSSPLKNPVHSLSAESADLDNFLGGSTLNQSTPNDDFDSPRNNIAGFVVDEGVFSILAKIEHRYPQVFTGLIP